ncbi:MAG: dipeptide epimerase [Planctomycetes bacterium]|nr:dipeptide epimerase [Planctomycetota bacterium]MCB9868418.1 dipeptide epimerase [Planctomycetota bacterium]
MKLRVRVFSLPLRHTFTIAHGSRDEITTVVVELADGDHRGYGESQAIDYYGVSAEAMAEQLSSVRDQIESTAWETPEEFWHAMLPHLGEHRFALCALDEAAHDLWGKRLGQPVWKLWGLDTTRTVPSDYTIGLASIEVMIAKLREFDGWPIYKIKLGTDHDLEIVRALRQHTDAVFRVDANTAWTPEQTIRNALELRELGVEFIEQPLRADDVEGMRRVRSEVALPVIADESCLVEADVERCAELFHGINIKLTKCGGMTPARAMIRRARELGLSVMVGCMTESSIGISAIAQLLPLLDYVDMDGAVLIDRDLADGVRLERGRAIYPATPGNGVTLHADL